MSFDNNTTFDFFQFHKGTIKPIVTVDTTIVQHGFQFHKGTIKPAAPSALLLTVSPFNSIKVQLSHVGSPISRLTINLSIP